MAERRLGRVNERPGLCHGTGLYVALVPATRPYRAILPLDLRVFCLESVLGCHVIWRLCDYLLGPGSEIASLRYGGGWTCFSKTGMMPRGRQ